MDNWRYLKCPWKNGMLSSEAHIEIPVFGKEPAHVYMAKSELIPLDKHRCLAAVNVIKQDKDVAVISLSDLLEQRMKTFRVQNNYLI